MFINEFWIFYCSFSCLDSISTRFWTTAPSFPLSPLKAGIFSFYNFKILISNDITILHVWFKKILNLIWTMYSSLLTFTNKSQFEATFLNMPFSVCIYFDTIFSIIVSNWARLSTPVTPWKRSFFFSIFKVALLHIVCYAQPWSFFLQKYLILLVLINMHIWWS